MGKKKSLVGWIWRGSRDKRLLHWKLEAFGFMLQIPYIIKKKDKGGKKVRITIEEI